MKELYGVLVGVLMMSIIFMLLGFHNIDLAYNMVHGEECIDFNGVEEQPAFQLYNEGLALLTLSGTFVFISIVLLIIGLITED